MSTNVYLALSYKNYHLGAAFYDEETEIIHILNDIAEDDEFTSLSHLIHEIQPAFVIASLSQDANFLKKLRKLCNFNVPNATRQDDSDIDEPPEQDNFDVTCGYETLHRSAVVNDDIADDSQIPVFNAHRQHTQNNNNASAAAFKKSSSFASNFFKSDSKTTSAAAANINNDHNNNGNDDDDENEEDKVYAVLTLLPHLTFEENEAKKRIKGLFSSETVSSDLMASFRFDFDSTNMVRALGALLRYLDQQRIGVEFDEITKKTPISAFNTVTLDDAVEIDKTTFKALQVFESEYVPSTVKRRPGILTSLKDGVSLFSVCNICRSVPGKRLLRRWFERPIYDRTILRERHSAVSFFYQDCNLDATKFIRNKMKDISNVRPILRRLRNGSASVSDWINIYATAYAAVEIVDFIEEREISLPILKGKFTFYNDVCQLAAVICEVMDFQESKTENRFIVKEGVDDDLDLLKDKYYELPERLTLIAKDEAEMLEIETCSVAYVPIIGFLLIVSEDARISPRMASKLELIYTAGTEVNYKSPRMKTLDQEIGDIKMQIIDAETTSVLRLQSLVLKRSTSLCQAVDVAATLDCLMSFALVGRELNWHRPSLVDEAIIDIGLARHPLSEITCPFTFVPNPIKSGGQYTKVKLISGPNASGKSVYLKMVGIVAYLAHIGSFVPADHVIIGPINRIVTRMYTIDSVMDGMSSFANDLKQMSGAIRKSNEFSLVIMDEFGKGTMTEVGLSLLASSLNYWLSKGHDHCPHIFASSHFHSLPTLLDDSDLLSYHTLDVHQNGDELEFQFKLIEGVIDNSYASYTALKNGISREIVDRANKVYEHLQTGNSLIDIPRRNYAAEEHDYVLAERMEDLIGNFYDWDLNNDPVGFLRIAQDVLSPDGEEEECETAEEEYEAALVEEDEEMVLEAEEVVVEEKEVVEEDIEIVEEVVLEAEEEEAVREEEEIVAEEKEVVISEEEENEEEIPSKRSRLAQEDEDSAAEKENDMQ